MSNDIRAALDAAEQHATAEIWANHPLAIILGALIKQTRAVLAAGPAVPEGREPASVAAEASPTPPADRMALAMCRLVDPTTGTCATGEICRRCRKDSAAVAHEIARQLRAWEQEQVQRAWLDPRLGEPWPEDRQPAPPAGQAASTLRSAVNRLLEAIVGLGDVDDAVQFARAALAADEVRFNEGQAQRGNGNGGPITPKPPIKPEPTGGHLLREGQLWGGYQPRP